VAALYWKPVGGLQIAMDGPSGSGKGTVAKRVGEELGLPVLDTGLLYRFSGWQAVEAGVDLADETAVLEVLHEVLPQMRWSGEGMLFAGTDCNSSLRGGDIGCSLYTSDAADKAHGVGHGGRRCGKNNNHSARVEVVAMEQRAHARC